MYKILLIVASGKSSRFGGEPKAFCKIGNITNADNTIQYALKVYDKVYIAVNKEVYAQHSNTLVDAEMFSIDTGQGDAHSLLKCLQYIKSKEHNLEKISVCWGDAVFIDETPFYQLLAQSKHINRPVCVACSTDKNPYAWFDTTEEQDIIKAHFSREEGMVSNGIHDQSLFVFDIEFAIKYLSDYKEYLGITDEGDDSCCSKNEMKLLYSFEYLQKKGYPLAKCIQIEPEKVLSFNTKEELKSVLELYSKIQVFE